MSADTVTSAPARMAMRPRKFGVGPGPVDVFDFLNTPEPEYRWRVGGLIEADDRVILTGGFGAGKSTLLRQIAVKTSAGLHPFNDEKIDPLSVLLVDLENPGRIVRRQLDPLVRMVSHLTPDRLRVWSRPEGCDLSKAEERLIFEDAVGSFQPDLMLIGPLYKLSTGDVANGEIAHRQIIDVIDRLRARFEFAIIIEAHAGYGGTKHPIHSSIWSRWPEVGLHLDERGRLTEWRPARDVRDWPKDLRRSPVDGGWPFDRAPHEAKNKQRTTSDDHDRLREILEEAGKTGLTARECGDRLYGQAATERLRKANEAKTRRKLEKIAVPPASGEGPWTLRPTT